jgi:hypothetical protein
MWGRLFVMLGLDPSISFRRFSGLRFAPPEHDGLYASSFRSIQRISGSSGNTQARPSAI